MRPTILLELGETAAYPAAIREHLVPFSSIHVGAWAYCLGVIGYKDARGYFIGTMENERTHARDWMNTGINGLAEQLLFAVPEAAIAPCLILDTTKTDGGLAQMLGEDGYDWVAEHCPNQRLITRADRERAATVLAQELAALPPGTGGDAIKPARLVTIPADFAGTPSKS